jgi:hypothetical protein
MAKKNKKTSVKQRAGRVNKSAWIRSQPASLSAKEVVDKAEGEGIALSLAQVYTARSTAKRRPDAGARSQVTATKRGPGRPKAIEAKKAISGDLRRQFMVMAVRIGTDEAKRLLERIADVESGN